MSTNRGSLSTHRRSLLLNIALLCVAVFCQHSAHMAKTASQPFRATPCRAKVASVSYVPESKIKLRARRAARPSRDSLEHNLAQYSALTPVALAELNASAQRAERQDRRAESIAPQFRSFYLRV